MLIVYYFCRSYNYNARNYKDVSIRSPFVRDSLANVRRFRSNSPLALILSTSYITKLFSTKNVLKLPTTKLALLPRLYVPRPSTRIIRRSLTLLTFTSPKYY
jgi:hypothetical protein